MALKKKVGMQMLNRGEVIALINRRGERVEKHSEVTMRKYANEVLKLARLNVPVQDFHVEDSIQKEEARSGINRRIEIKVGVDSAMLRELSGIDYDYSYWLHEAQYNLGDLSRVKEAISKSEDPRATVGPHYLLNAMNSVKDDALSELRSGIRRALKR